MQRLTVVIVLLSAIALPAQALEESETLQRSFTLPQANGGRLVVVDNVNGAIDVEVGSADTVELELEQTWRGRNENAIARAKEAVVFEVVQEPGKLLLKQGGPWRCNGRSDCEHRDYDVKFDWKLRVPADVDVELMNVNGGAIDVAGVRGAVTARHVNGAVELVDVGGTVQAHTVNGRLTGTFAIAPREALTFKTVNGPVDLTFPKDLNADVAFTTVNGELYTDFPYAVTLPTAEQRGLLDLVKSGNAKIRIGNGGAWLRCDTVNGDIRIHSR